MLRASLRDLLYEKIRLKEEVAEKLGSDRVEKVRGDHHARKPPLRCGMAVHSVVGCTFACTYCYLPDTGVSFSRAQPYGLSGEEMALALLLNPYFLPSPLGTYIALGSLGEPLHPVGTWRTLEYIDVFYRLLGNPLQLSTKVPVSAEVAAKLARASRAVNPLVTAITLRFAGILEPRAPSVSERLESVRALRAAKLHPMLFLKPIVPGFEGDALDLIREAARAGVEAVVLGSLRVTPSILARLKAKGVEVSAIVSRVRSLRDGVQVSVPMQEQREELAGEARRAGVQPLYSACCANTLNVYLATRRRIPCAGLDFVDQRSCARCSVDCRGIRVEVDSSEVKWAAKEFLGLEVRGVEEEGLKLLLLSESSHRVKRRLHERKEARALLGTAFRRRLDAAP